MGRRCVIVLGGSFDPVHNGHVALGEYGIALFAADELRIVPAGSPWQKAALQANGPDRVAMLRYAFDKQKIPVTIDQQEIERQTATYTIDTLRALRAELGAETSIVMLIGADQLQQLDTWKDWQQLFDHAHICAASRPEFAMDAAHMSAQVAQEFARRAGTTEQLANTPHGFACMASDLAIDISATKIRTALQRGDQLEALIPPKVLDYIQQHHLYQSQS